MRRWLRFIFCAHAEMIRERGDDGSYAVRCSRCNHVASVIRREPEWKHAQPQALKARKATHAEIAQLRRVK